MVRVHIIFQLMGLGAVHMQADGQPVPIDHGHDLRPFADFGLAYAIQPAQERAPNPLPCPVERPLIQPSPARAVRAVLLGQVSPSTACFQHIQNAVQRLAVVVSRTTSFTHFLGNERFNHRPLFIA